MQIGLTDCLRGSSLNGKNMLHLGNRRVSPHPTTMTRDIIRRPINQD